MLPLPHHGTHILAGNTTDEPKILTSDSAKCHSKNNTEERWRLMGRWGVPRFTGQGSLPEEVIRTRSRRSLGVAFSATVTVSLRTVGWNPCRCVSARVSVHGKQGDPSKASPRRNTGARQIICSLAGHGPEWKLCLNINGKPRQGGEGRMKNSGSLCNSQKCWTQRHACIINHSLYSPGYVPPTSLGPVRNIPQTASQISGGTSRWYTWKLFLQIEICCWMYSKIILLTEAFPSLLKQK